MTGIVAVGGSPGSLPNAQVTWSLAGQDFAGFRAMGYVLSSEFEADGCKLQLGLYKTSDKSQGGWTESGIFVFCAGPGPSGYRISLQLGEKSRVCKSHRFEGKSENYGFWAWALCLMPPVQDLVISVTLLQASELSSVHELERASLEAEVATFIEEDAKKESGEVAPSFACCPGQVLRSPTSWIASAPHPNTAPSETPRPAEPPSNNACVPHQESTGPSYGSLQTPRGNIQVPRLHWQPVLHAPVESPKNHRESKVSRRSSISSCTLSSSSDSRSGSWVSSSSSTDSSESPVARPANHKHESAQSGGTGGSPVRKAPGRAEPAPPSSKLFNPHKESQEVTGTTCVSSQCLDRLSAILSKVEQCSKKMPLSPELETYFSPDSKRKLLNFCDNSLSMDSSINGASLSNNGKTDSTTNLFDPVVNVYDRSSSDEVIRVIEIECLRVSAEDIDWQESPGGLLVSIQKRKVIDEGAVTPIGPLWQTHGKWTREFSLQDAQGRFDVCGTDCWLKDGILSISMKRPLQVRGGRPRHEGQPVAVRPLRPAQRAVHAPLDKVPTVPQPPRVAHSGSSTRGSKGTPSGQRPASRPGIPKLNLTSASRGLLGDGCCLTTRGGA